MEAEEVRHDYDMDEAETQFGYDKQLKQMELDSKQAQSANEWELIAPDGETPILYNPNTQQTKEAPSSIVEAYSRKTSKEAKQKKLEKIDTAKATVVERLSKQLEDASRSEAPELRKEIERISNMYDYQYVATRSPEVIKALHEYAGDPEKLNAMLARATESADLRGVAAIHYFMSINDRASEPQEDITKMLDDARTKSQEDNDNIISGPMS